MPNQGNFPIHVHVNGQPRSAEVEHRTLLVHFLRDQLGLTGTHVGCETTLCGACTVLVDGLAVKSCTMLAVQCDGASVTTIEGLAANGTLHPVQQAWIDEDVAQCGYCQAGQIMAVASLLAETPNPSDDEIDAKLTNLCRCGTYTRIRAGIRRAAELMKRGAA